MNFFFQSFLGGLHTLSAITALIAGFIVLRNNKGTSFHKKIGYLYAVSMVILNISAIPLGRLWGGIGWFHLFIVISLPYVLLGLYYPIFKRSDKDWQVKHFEFMCWSYVGLIAAFCAEVIIRVPLMLAVNNIEQFAIAVFVIAGLVGYIGSRYVTKYRQSKFS